MDEATQETALDVLSVLLGAGLGLLAGLAASLVLTIVSSVITRRHRAFGHLARRTRFQQRLLLGVAGLGVGVLISTRSVGEDLQDLRGVFTHGFVIVLIVLAAYLLTAALAGLEEMVLDRFRGSETSPHARRVRTQMQVIRRVGVAVVWVSALAGSLLTFESFRAIGAALFTSAGVLSIIAGLAAQTSLGNLFAGIQIAFTDAVRVGDLVRVGTEFGTIEELTLTYVVVRTWDDRRLIMPSTYFTTTTFENWTRREANLLGTVELDLDYLAPVKALRVELQRIVSASDLWDGRTCNMQVTEATDGRIRLRAVVSAASAGNVWDLRCQVREELVDWIQREAPYALIRTRLEPEPTPAPSQEERDQFTAQIVHEWNQVSQAEEEPDTLSEVNAASEEEALPARDPEELRRARKVAAKRDRLASRRNPIQLSGHDSVLPLPSSDTTRVLTPAELKEMISAEQKKRTPQGGVETDATADQGDQSEARRGPAAPRTSILERFNDVDEAADEDHTAVSTSQARLYSGSPEAEARAERLAGPSPQEMAEREAAAKRRIAEQTKVVDQTHVNKPFAEGDD